MSRREPLWKQDETIWEVTVILAKTATLGKRSLVAGLDKRRHVKNNKFQVSNTNLGVPNNVNTCEDQLNEWKGCTASDQDQRFHKDQRRERTTNKNQTLTRLRSIRTTGQKRSVLTSLEGSWQRSKVRTEADSEADGPWKRWKRKTKTKRRKIHTRGLTVKTKGKHVRMESAELDQYRFRRKRTDETTRVSQMSALIRWRDEMGVSTGSTSWSFTEQILSRSDIKRDRHE